MIRRAGKLDQDLEFQCPEDTNDGKGGVTREWVTVDTRRASKEHKGSKTFHALSQRYMQLSEVFRLREFEVAANWRIVCGGHVYRIIGVELMDRETVVAVEIETQGTNTYGH